MVKNLVFPRIFLYCVSLPDVVSGLLLSERPRVRIALGTPKNTSAFAEVFLYTAIRMRARAKQAPLPKGGWHAHQNKGVTGGFFYKLPVCLTERL